MNKLLLLQDNINILFFISSSYSQLIATEWNFILTLLSSQENNIYF